MRRTYAYNGIFIGVILGFAAAVFANNIVVGIIVAIVASVLCFLAIRGLENLLNKGMDKAEQAIKNKIDEKNRAKAQEVPIVDAGTKLCPYCGSEVSEGDKFCLKCGKPLT